MRIELNARSLAVIHFKDHIQLSIAVDNGDHVIVRVSPHQAALITQDFARFTADQFRQVTREQDGEKTKLHPVDFGNAKSGV